jgi:uncharacterized protein YcgI (DUF1989 family)
VNLAEATSAKITEMNEEIIPQYISIIPLAPMTALTVKIMQAEVRRAVDALANGDVVENLEAYAAIKDYKQ